MRRLAAVAAGALALLAMPAGAYYHYTRYLTSAAPYTPVPAKYDINGLPNKTITVFVSDSGPSALAPNDSFASVLSQVRQAVVAWNSIDTSDLRVAFGGLIQNETNPNNPGIEVTFGEVPPGLLAHTFITWSNTPSVGPTGQFFPIVHAQTVFRRDLSVEPGPSYLDSFFTTAVHEFGHALGLQHTFTSSAMTVATNRNVNRARPLDADDIAGLSVLYPKAGYSATVGAISGHVTANGQPVGLASVVALRPGASAISTITNPDGTYRLDGLPPDAYYVYVHPVPPGVDPLTPPQDAAGRSIVSTVPTFETIFYPGTRDLTQFTPINVSRGATVSGVDFQVRPRTGYAMYDGQTYSYIGGSIPVKPAFVNSLSAGENRLSFVASPAVVAPTSVQVPGLGTLTAQTYDGGGSLALAVYFPLGAGTGPRHLLLNLGTDMYVLPSALNLVQKGPPQGVAATPQPDGSVIITGRNLGPDSSVFFDGLPARIRVAFSGTDASGRIVVVPPTGFNGQHATITVFNADGQSSMMTQSAAPPVYSYDFGDVPQIIPSLTGIPAGASAVVEVNGLNTRFVEGQVTVGFGSHDVFVRRVWVQSANRVLANVTVQANAAIGASEISVISGFQTVTQPYAFLTQPANPRLPTIALPLNPQPGQTNFFPGSVVTIAGSNLASAGGPTVTLTDVSGNTVPAQVASASANLVAFVVPASMPSGVAVLRLNNGVDAALPIAIQIDAQPPVIGAVSTASGLALDASRPISAGELLNLQVLGLDAGVVSAPSRLRVLASGVELPITQILPAGQPGAWLVQVVVTQSFSGQQVPLTISQDGTVSNPYVIVVR